MAKYDSLLSIAKVLKRVPGLKSTTRQYNRWRHSMIENKLSPFLKQAESACFNTTRPVPYSSIKDPGIIWIFWWQGIDTAPEIVRYCINSIKTHAGHRRVILIDKDNIRQYTTLSEHVFDLVNSGAITLTHLSDLLRFNLLYNYGGLWMDATLLTTESLDSVDTSTLFTCSGFNDPTLFNVSEGRWTGFFIGGPAGQPLFLFMDNFFSNYWQNNSEMPDYFLIDYALDYAWSSNIGNFRNTCLRYKDIQPRMFDLQQSLSNTSFLSMHWEEITDKTYIFKLSYKKTTSTQAKYLMRQINQTKFKPYKK
ncbi:capsular polysaccharide synthesis protein [Bifidobacterium cebidarum]|uniref:Capsular polysaccharide biosynthesis protein n=1 Tax=Bifidobacterium cebidarum TaxID=2650773 RepID=A0A6I1GNJ4_9BIFI|nr:capsular polysaccharide synthesis protein [Bifidobacterium cebidarum]KAB7788131.1 Capsular polysaccharide biosynthesis protein [Bifidobacterium cebidarum]